jgi:cyclic beta-1,2-glucan synthetase
LYIEPCIPRDWQRFSIRYRHGDTTYNIAVENPDRACGGVAAIELDGVTLQGLHASVALVDDGAAHRVRVVLHKEPN